MSVTEYMNQEIAIRMQDAERLVDDEDTTRDHSPEEDMVHETMIM